MRRIITTFSVILGFTLGIFSMKTPDVGPEINISTTPPIVESYPDYRIALLERCELNRLSSKKIYEDNPDVQTFKNWMNTEQKCIDLKRRYENATLVSF